MKAAERIEQYFATPVWWVDATRCDIVLAGRGTRAGDGEVDQEAIILSGDSSFAIEGTRQELVQFVETLRLMVRP